MRVKRLTRCALLTAIALAIFVLEAQIPIPFPVPGMKLGLSNIITLFALFSFGWKDALAIVVIRILLGNLASGQVMALLYSLGGGLLSFAGMALLCRILTAKQVWAAGAAGGLLHNLGQMAADAGPADLAAGPAPVRACDRAVYRAVRAAAAAAQAHFGQRRYPR